MHKQVLNTDDFETTTFLKIQHKIFEYLLCSRNLSPLTLSYKIICIHRDDNKYYRFPRLVKS